MFSERGFTLIELLIVIGILAILSTTVILVVNPAEYLKKSRDTTRLADLSTINKAVSLYQTDGGDSFGASDTVYVSIPDTSTTCANLGLPSLPDGWSYACVIEDNLIRVNGNGWIPIDFTSLTYGTILSALPIDPTNTVASGNYYTYASGSWKLTAMFESEKYASSMNKDGGPDIGLYELGSDLTLAPFQRGLIGYWRFNEGSGTSASDSSGNGNNGTLLPATSTPTWTTGKSFGALSFDGVDDYVDIEDSLSVSFTNPDLTISAWVYLNENQTGERAIVRKGNQWQLGIYPSEDKIRNLVKTNGINGWTSANDVDYTINTQTWYFFALTYNGSVLNHYANGVQVGNSIVTGDIVDGSYNIGIGADSGGATKNINGTIDDVRIYNRALPAEEISAIYNATK